MKIFTALFLLLALVQFQSARVAAAVVGKQREARVQSAVYSLGQGEASHVRVRLADRSTVEGWIQEADETGFEVVATDGTQHHIAYSQVKGLSGHNAFTGRSILITVGVVVGILAIVLIGLANDN